MVQHVTLDVRGLPPPELLERVVEAIERFAPGDTLRLLIDCIPHPLFRLLERNGYRHYEAQGTESLYDITIWAEPELAGSPVSGQAASVDYTV